MNKLPGFITAITSDVMALVMGSFPTATIAQTTGSLYESWSDKRMKIARKILFEEISKAKKPAVALDPDSFIGLLHRYLSATKQGAAHHNLRLMAQVLRGSLESDCPFTPDELAIKAEQVASLSHKEIKFLATLWRTTQESSLVPDGGEIQAQAYRKALELLVPTVFKNNDEFSAAGGALSRTGLIILRSTFGNIRFDVSPYLEDIIKLCDLESSLLYESSSASHDS